MAIDCEMDHVKPEYYSAQGCTMVCKISLVNSLGEVVLDTLVQPYFEGRNYSEPYQIPGYKNLEFLHGVKAEWLHDAPTFSEVRAHIIELAGKEESVDGDADNQSDKNSSSGSEPQCVRNFDPDIHSIFVGHGVVTDLKVMDLYGVPYFDTHLLDSRFEQSILAH